MPNIETLKQKLLEHFGSAITEAVIYRDELTIEVPKEQLKTVCLALRKEAAFAFNMLIDVSGVDYLEYGLAEWRTETTTATGFDRGVDANKKVRMTEWNKPRFASVYQLLSIKHNHRLRVRSFVADDMMIDSVVDVWPVANWYEREAFDLFGLLYKGHPDLRRILTDYGFVGHPFRKDFPLSGHVEVRYDAEQGRVIYEPVDIEPRVLVPKTIRHDSRYLDEAKIRAREEEVKKAEAARKAAEEGKSEQ